MSLDSKKVEIHLSGNSVVKGDIFGDENVIVEIYLEKGSEIHGEIISAELVEE